MFRFNPDRELRKIQHGGRNKILYGIITMLLIISIGSTYALYQVRHSKRIIYTTVADFSKDIKLAVYFDGGKQKSFPSKDQGYVYSEIKCDNGGTATFDYVNWKLRLETNGPDKCDVYFTKGTPNLTSNCKNTPLNKCLEENNDNFANLIDDDPDHNIRYIGATPNNYIWFNCDDYNGITQENAVSEKHCEKWRIIGLMKDMQKGDGTTEDLVKIVRADSIGNYSWDNKNTSTGAESNYGKNDWTTAELMYLLNPNYGDHQLNSVRANNSLYWNSGNGKCSNSSGNATTNCDFTSTGLKGDDSGPTKSMIESVKWYLGGWITASGVLTQSYYTYERGETVYTGRPKTWTGKVALIYPSDYGYASSGGGSTTRDACLAKDLYNWNSGQWRTDCARNDWLKPSSTIWTIMPYSVTSNNAFNVYSGGHVYYNHVYSAAGVRPSLYLTSSVKLLSGDGSSNTPYILAP